VRRSYLAGIAGGTGCGKSWLFVDVPADVRPMHERSLKTRISK
jgi:hypothetical protein